MKTFRVRVPEVNYVEYEVGVGQSEGVYVALGKAQQDSTYKIKPMTHKGFVPANDMAWLVEMNGEWVPFGKTDDENGSFWHVWGMGDVLTPLEAELK